MMIEPKNKKCNNPTVLGLDVSPVHTGIAIWQKGVAYYEICCSPVQTHAGRLAYFEHRLNIVLRRYKPDLAVKEDYAMDAIGRTFHIGEIGGIARLCTCKADVEMLDVSPSELKKHATGRGSASKQAVIDAVKEHYGTTVTSDDVADAIVAAHFGYVYLTNDANRRCELETVKKFKRVALIKKVQVAKKKVFNI